MSNFGTAIEATNTALNSSGSAMKENEAYMESLEAKTNLLQASFQELSNDVISKDMISGVLDLANNFLQLADSEAGVTAVQAGLAGGLAMSGTALLQASKIVPNLIGSFRTLSTVLSGGILPETVSAFSALPAAIGIATVAVVGLVAAFNGIENALDPVVQAQKALEELDTIQTEVASNNRIIELADRYDTLRESIESGKLSEEELTSASSELDSVRAELASVTDGLVDSELAYGDVLDGNVNKAREAAEAEKERLQARTYQWIEDNEQKYANAVSKSKQLLDDISVTEKALAMARENYGADSTALYNDLVTHVNEWQDALKSGASNADELYSGVRTELYALTGVLTDADAKTGDFWQTFQNLVPQAINTKSVVGELNGTLQDTKLELDPLEGLISEFGDKLAGLVVDGVITADEALTMLNVNGEQTITKTQLMSAAFEQLLPKIQSGAMSYAEAAEKLGWYEEDVRHMVQAMQEVPGASNAFTSSISTQVDALLSLEDELADAAIKIQEFNEKMEGGEKGDTLKQYASIYSQFLEAYEQGLVGSNVYKAAIETFFSPEFLEGFEGDYRAAGEVLGSEFFQAIFAEGGEDYGANLLAILSDYGEVVEEAGSSIRQVKNDQGELIAAFSETEDGLYPLTINFQKLGEMLGLDQSVMDAFADALSAFGMDIAPTAQELWDFAESVDALKTNLDGMTTLDLGQYIGSISHESVEDINSLVGYMHDLEGIDLTTVDMTSVVQSLAEAGKSASEIKAVTDALQSMDGVQFTNLPVSMDDTINKFVTAQEEANKATDDTNTLGEQVAEPVIDANTSGFDTAFQSTMAKIQKLNNTPAVIKIITQKTDDSEATGTDYAPGGPTLVNEEGPEIIVEKGKARIAGGGEPTITDIQKGATVYNAKDTEKILQNGMFDGVINAYASGVGRGGFIPWTATSSGVPDRISTSSTASPVTSAYSAGYDSGYTAASQDYSAIVEEVSATANGALNEDTVKEHQSIISLLEAEYSLMEKQGASAEELNGKAGEIQNAYHNLNEYLRGTDEYLNGDNDTLKSVADNSAKWYEWQEKIVDNLAEAPSIYTAIQNLLSSNLDLLQAQEGSLDDQVATIHEYQDNLHTEAERLRAVLARAKELSLTDEQIAEIQTNINELGKEWWEWQEKVYEAAIKTSKEYESILGLLQAEFDFLEAQNNPLTSGHRVDILNQEQEKLHEEANRLREILATAKEQGYTEEQIRDIQAQIYGLSKQWWEIEDKKTSTIKQQSREYSTMLAGLKAEYDFIEASGRDTTGQERIDILTKQQELYHEEAERLREVLAIAEELKLTEEEIADIQAEINGLSKQWWDDEKKKMELLQDYLDATLDKEKSAIDALASQMQKYYQAQIDDIDEQIDKLNEANDVLEDQIELEEKLDAIAQARSKKVMVYKDGRWQYVSDTDAVSSATASYEEYERKKKLEDSIAELEKQKEAIQDLKDSWSNFGEQYDDIQEKWLISQELGFDTSLDSWQSLVEGAEVWAQKYIDIMTQMANLSDLSQYADYDSMLAAMGGGGSGSSGAGYSGGGHIPYSDSFIYSQWDADTQNIDYAQKILDSRSWAEAQTWANRRDIKMNALGISDEDVGSTQSFLDQFGETMEYARNAGLVSNAGVIAPTSNTEANEALGTLLASAGVSSLDELVHGKHANGTLSAPGGLSLVGEKGAELRILGKGDGIIPNNLTQNLMSWGSFTPNQYASQIASITNGQNMNVTIQALNLPNVTDGVGFVEYVKNNMFGQVLQLVH